VASHQRKNELETGVDQHGMEGITLVHLNLKEHGQQIQVVQLPGFFTVQRHAGLKGNWGWMPWTIKS
jgi:hypothetical protein